LEEKKISKSRLLACGLLFGGSGRENSVREILLRAGRFEIQTSIVVIRKRADEGTEEARFVSEK
jgi:hypothetical protein